MNFASDEVDKEGILKDMVASLDRVRYGGPYANIFIHNSSLFVRGGPTVYSEALLCCPLYHENNWHSILAITSHEDPNRVIASSNSFYWEDRNGAFHLQNKRHRIFDRLVYTYHRMRNYPAAKQIVVHEEALLVANSFTSVNSGHDLSIILDMVAYYRAHAASIAKIVILKAAHWIPNNYVLMRLLLGPQGCAKLFEIEWNSVYRFVRIHIPTASIIHMTKHPTLCEELRQLVLKNAPVTSFKKGVNVVLLKTHRDKNVISVNNQLVCERLLKRLESVGWLVVNPEQANILTLCATLMHANIILFSYGSILYTHMIFFNPSAKLKWIAVGKDKLTPAYNYVNTAERRPEKIHVATRDLDSNMMLTNQVFDRLGSGDALVSDARPVSLNRFGSVWVLGDPTMITNSGLLQEHFFVHAVLEAAKGVSFIAGVNHRDATCMVEYLMPNGSKVRRTTTVLFPMKRVNMIRELWIPITQRKFKYFFRGVLSGYGTATTTSGPLKRKQWVRGFAQPENHIEHSLRGRGKGKYVFDKQYHQLMCNSQFVLCPIDVYPWSYRLLEAIMCRCIPVLNAGDDDILACRSGFKVYRTNEVHTWREDWVEENLQKLMKLHTLSDPSHELNIVVARGH